MKTIILFHVVATIMMAGVIWVIQVLHYPLFSAVGASEFRTYEAEHTTRITLIVLPLMAVEALTAMALVAEPPLNVPRWLLWLGLGLVGVVWFMTAFVHVPQHGRLAQGFDTTVHNALVTSNWIRTLAWTARVVIVMILIDRVFFISAS